MENRNGDRNGDGRRLWLAVGAAVVSLSLLLSVRVWAQEPKDAEGYSARGQDRFTKGEYDKSIADFTEAIRLDPQARYYAYRGWVRHQAKKYDSAIADYDKSIQLSPRSASAYLYRGILLTERNEIKKAIIDLDLAVKLDPKNATVHLARAEAWSKKGDYGEAIAAYDKAEELDSKQAAAWNHRAWLEATCPDAKIRNGKLAVAHATKACELTEWKDLATLDTLSAAYAEAGDFAKAIKWQTKVRDKAPADERAEYQSRLDLYQAHKPYRDAAQ